MKLNSFVFSPKKDFSTSLLWVVPRINQSRTSYLNFLEDLPQIFKDVATTHLNERLRRGKYRPHIGEYLPWLLADVLKVPRSKKLDQTILGWLSLYFSVLMLDDLLDSPKRVSTDCILTASLLQQRGLAQMLAISPNPIELQRCFNSAFNKTALAARNEMNRRNGDIIPFNKGEIADLCNKGALLTICAEALVILSGCPEDSKQTVASLLRPLLTALQLLDDITDCAEDFSIGALTVPLTLHATRGEKKAWFSEKNNGEELLAAMILDGTLGESIRLTISFLRDAVKLTESHPLFSEAQIKTYTAELAHRADEALIMVIECQKELLLMKRQKNSPEFYRLVRETKRRLIIIMQTT